MLHSKKRILLATIAVLMMVSAGMLFAQGGGAAPAAAAPGPPTISVHGYMQNRFYFGEGANPEFRSERISISTLATFADASTAFVELYYHPWAPAAGLYLESAYYDKVLADSHLRVGKGRRQTFGITPAYPNRKTSNYGIVSEAFTQDRIQGLQYFGTKNNLDIGLSLHTAYRLGTRNIGEIPGDSLRNATHQVPHLALREANGDLSQKLQVSGRVGMNTDGWKAGVSLSFAGLDRRDVTNLTTSGATNPLTPGATPALLPVGSDNNMSQWGLDFMKKWSSGFMAQGEFYGASVSELDYNAWNVLAGQEFTSGWKVILRYAQQNMDTPLTSNPLSWDVQQTSISVVQPIAKSVWIQYEYEINTERTNTGGDVGNDVFFIELFSGF